MPHYGNEEAGLHVADDSAVCLLSARLAFPYQAGSNQFPSFLCFSSFFARIPLSKRSGIG